MSDEKKGFMDRFKMPDMSAIAENLKEFLVRAEAKIDAQTAAIKTLAEVMRTTNGKLERIEERVAKLAEYLGNYFGYDNTDLGVIHGRPIAGASGGMADGGDAEPDAGGADQSSGNSNGRLDPPAIDGMSVLRPAAE